MVDAFAPKPDDRLDRRAFWELRHARLRLALAENELAWAQEAMTSGYINPAAALEILNATMDERHGDTAMSRIPASAEELQRMYERSRTDRLTTSPTSLRSPSRRASRREPWPEPDPLLLRRGRRPPVPFPDKVLAPEWDQWVHDTAKSAGAPPDYVAAAPFVGYGSGRRQCSRRFAVGGVERTGNPVDRAS